MHQARKADRGHGQGLLLWKGWWGQVILVCSVSYPYIDKGFGLVVVSIAGFFFFFLKQEMDATKLQLCLREASIRKMLTIRTNSLGCLSIFLSNLSEQYLLITLFTSRKFIGSFSLSVSGFSRHKWIYVPLVTQKGSVWRELEGRSLLKSDQTGILESVYTLEWVWVPQA